MSQNNNVPEVDQTQQKLIHKIIFYAAIATPIMTLPQAYQIWFQGNKGASAFTWASYVIIAAIWLRYGLETKDRPIIVSQSLCIIVYGAIVVGLLIK